MPDGRHAIHLPGNQNEGPALAGRRRKYARRSIRNDCLQILCSAASNQQQDRQGFRTAGRVRPPQLAASFIVPTEVRWPARQATPVMTILYADQTCWQFLEKRQNVATLQLAVDDHLGR